MHLLRGEKHQGDAPGSPCRGVGFPPLSVSCFWWLHEFWVAHPPLLHLAETPLQTHQTTAKQTPAGLR